MIIAIICAIYMDFIEYSILLDLRPSRLNNCSMDDQGVIIILLVELKI